MLQSNQRQCIPPHFMSAADAHTYLSQSSPHGIQASIKPYKPFCADQVSVSQKPRKIKIQWAIRFPTSTQQLLNRFNRTHNPVRRRPTSFQQIQADFSRLEIDVGMAAWRYEPDIGWRRWIIRRQDEREVKATTYDNMVNTIVVLLKLCGLKYLRMQCFLVLVKWLSAGANHRLSQAREQRQRVMGRDCMRQAL